MDLNTWPEYVLMIFNSMHSKHEFSQNDGYIRSTGF